MKPKPFDKLSAAQKRVAIARDALAQLKAGTYTAEEGTYLSGELGPIDQDSLLAYTAPCNLCAKGGLLLSSIRVGNQFSFQDRFEAEIGMERVLQKWFTIRQTNEMEASFEGWDNRGRSKSAKFYRKHTDPNKRLAAILKNIIRNHGEFKP